MATSLSDNFYTTIRRTIRSPLSQFPFPPINIRIANMHTTNYFTQEAATRKIPSIELNNTAIAYWQSGRSQEAMEIFQVALSNLRDDCNESETDERTSAMDISTSQSDGTTKSCSDEINSCVSVPVLMKQDTCFLTCYNRAVFLDADCVSLKDTVLPAVILFNIGLLHHSRGVESDNMSLLEHASRLYRMSLQLLRKQANEGNNLLLFLALFNNLAHIDSIFFRMDDMKLSLNRMEVMLSENDSVSDPSTDEEDFVIFSMNIMFGDQKEYLLAPAA